MKKETLKNIILGIGGCALLFSMGVNIKAASYLYDSKDVKYDNSRSGLTSTYVDGAIDELYALAEGSIEQRLEALENQVANVSPFFAFDPTDVIATHNKTSYNSYEWNTYTATEDCVVGLVANYAPQIEIDNVRVMYDPRSGNGLGSNVATFIPLKAGQELSVYSYNEQLLVAYRLK